MLSMPRRTPTKAELVSRLHRGLRPKLTSAQVRDLGLAHTINLDAIATGQADEATLWQTVGGVFTWCYVADQLQTGVDEMRAQLEMATALVERYGRTGRVCFTGVEYQVAKRGVMVMDLLAEMVDKPTAVAAAEWSESKINELAGKHAEATR
jgi:hypothetical protein